MINRNSCSPLLTSSRSTVSTQILKTAKSKPHALSITPLIKTHGILRTPPRIQTRRLCRQLLTSRSTVPRLLWEDHHPTTRLPGQSLLHSRLYRPKNQRKKPPAIHERRTTQHETMTISSQNIDIYCVITKLIAKDLLETNGFCFGFAHNRGGATAILEVHSAI